MSTSSARHERAVRISLQLFIAALVAIFVVGFAAGTAFADIGFLSSPIGRPPVIAAQRIRATPIPPPTPRPVARAVRPQPRPVSVASQVKAPVKGEGSVQTGRRLAAQRGWVGAQWNALYELWDHESGWSPSARNRSSGACGIPQRHPCNGLSSQPVEAQIAWGLDYIAGRYGTPIGALAHFNAENWY